MNRLRTILLIGILLLTTSLAYSQLPSCGNNPSTHLYLMTSVGIMDYDVTLPISPTNPSSIGLWPGGIGLAVSENLNAAGPSPTFYTCSSGNYKYYNGFNWVTTGHSYGPSTSGYVNPGGGGGYIFNYRGGGDISRYDGSSNAIVLLNVPGLGNGGPFDIQGHCDGGFYVLRTDTTGVGAFMRKYDSTGVLQHSWTVSGTATQGGIGFAITNNQVFYHNQDGFMRANLTPPNGNLAFSIIPNSSTITPWDDFAACPVCDTMAISPVLPNADFTMSADTICPGDCINLTDLSSGQPYAWSWSFPGGSQPNSAVQNPSNICYFLSGSYNITLIATNNAGSDTITKSIYVRPNVAAIILGADTICAGDSLTLSAYQFPGIISLWSTGDTTQSITVGPLTTTSYTLQVSNGICSSTNSTTINVLPKPTATITGANSICAGDTTVLSGPTATNLSYLWSTGDTTQTISVSPTQNNVYSLVVSNGVCADSTSFLVTVNALPVATIYGPNLICQGDSVSLLSPTSSSSFLWSTGDTTQAVNIAPIVNSNYSLIISNGLCVDTAYHSVLVQQAPQATILGATTICIGDTTTLTTPGGAGQTYLWSTGDTTQSISVSPSATTSYSLIVANGLCADTNSFTIVVQSTPVASIIGNANICNGESTVLTAFPSGLSYLWSNTDTAQSITVTPGSNITYNLLVSNGSCSSSTTYSVMVHPTPVASVIGNLNICSGESTVLTAAGGTSYLWSTNDTTQSITVNPLVTTSYALIVSNGLCTDTTQVIVTVTDLPLASISGPAELCLGQTATLSAGSPAANYAWSTNEVTQTISTVPTVTSSYSLIVSNGNCADTATHIVTVNPVPLIAASATRTNCDFNTGTASAVASGGTPAYTYTWSGGGVGSTISSLGAGSYFVTVTDSKGCTAVTSTNVQMHVNPVATVNPFPISTIRIGESIQLSAAGGSQYVWAPGTSLNCTQCANPISTPSQSIEYCVSVSNENGCSDTVCTTILVDTTCQKLFIPNAFTPNGDGLNDYISIKNNCEINNLQFAIFNRWGNKVFETDDILNKWDGRYKGEPQPTSTFFYILKADINGKTINQQGDITLIR